MGRGYSGTGGGRDNPDMETRGFEGPIPRGAYDIGASRRHSSLGPEVMNLDPVGHAANDASEGCIVLPPNVRRMIAGSADKRLEVVR